MALGDAGFFHDAIELAELHLVVGGKTLIGGFDLGVADADAKPSGLRQAQRLIDHLLGGVALLMLQPQEGSAMRDVAGGDRYVVDDVFDLAGESRRRHEGHRHGCCCHEQRETC